MEEQSQEWNEGLKLSSPTGGQGAVYFIGIGGIGMSAIARYFHSKGIEVSGYDKTQTELTRELEQEGISIHYDENVAAIPKDVDLVVYTPAVPKEHAELVYYQKNGYKVVKRSDVLGAISADSFNICIAGTHGKTTITTMIAHILRHSGYGCNAFLGGISGPYPDLPPLREGHLRYAPRFSTTPILYQNLQQARTVHWQVPYRGI